MNNFCLKVRFSEAQHAISEFFLKTGVFSMLLFSNLFSSKPPQFLLTIKRFVSIKDCSRFSALCDLLESFYKNFFEKFRIFFPYFFDFFEMFPVEKDEFFAVSSWGRMVFEIYAYPFGYFLAL